VKPSGGTYVVRSGDTLWAVAAELLGAHASDAQIAAEVRCLYRLNAGVRMVGAFCSSAGLIDRALDARM
jgi:Tfp pilus assembly protein FimV